MEHLLLYQDDAKTISTFFIKLLKPLPGWRLVSPENWFESLAKEYKKRDLEVDFPLPSTTSTILTIPLLQRLQILRNLCEFHLEQAEHFWELLRVKDGENDWRIEPFGKDSENRRYWVFSDGRMYREIRSLAKRQQQRNSKNKEERINWDIEDESNWELVCLTRSDYDDFLASFTAPINAKDKLLMKMVREEIIPRVEPILTFQLAQHKKYFRPIASERVLLLPRKRSSRLLEKELEEEQRRLAEQEAQKEAEKARQETRRALLAQQSEFALLNAPKSREQVEKDLAAEREQRAEMRRLKREKELQIKAIEEAFYSTYNENNDNNEEQAEVSESVNVEIESESDESDEPEEEQIFDTTAIQVAPKSPIKLVLKISPKTTKTTEDTTNIDIPAQITATIDIQHESDPTVDVVDIITTNNAIDKIGQDSSDLSPLHSSSLEAIVSAATSSENI